MAAAPQHRQAWGIWFFSTEDNPAQRIAALFDYDYSWLDSSDWYTAHNGGSTNIWVFGHSENAWLLQQGGFFSSWSEALAGKRTTEATAMAVRILDAKV